MTMPIVELIACFAGTTYAAGHNAFCGPSEFERNPKQIMAIENLVLQRLRSLCYEDGRHQLPTPLSNAYITTVMFAAYIWLGFLRIKGQRSQWMGNGLDLLEMARNPW